MNTSRQPEANDSLPMEASAIVEALLALPDDKLLLFERLRSAYFNEPHRRICALAIIGNLNMTGKWSAEDISVLLPEIMDGPRGYLARMVEDEAVSQTRERIRQGIPS